MNWYILFVRSGKENKVMNLLRNWLDKEILRPFIPSKQKLFKTSGFVKREINPLFPGYVFIESEITEIEFIKNINKFIYASSDIIRILKYSDTEIAMRENEKNILLRLCNDDYCIGISKGIKCKDEIHIIDGPLKGCESIVKKINRHKRQAWIEMEFMGDVRVMIVALEILEKI
ncbi:transcriptional antiterminator NusG [Clostridium cavendishii DSM 21758]|uniref:Transcriptional antiterminator NusG n=1 Tax=Clostridium cavendishii DSM 21758 TaxID=1121302 RepID=A0A1M6MRK8_9CLOT|nr:antiterminator LoaP [Clostridium cavendishii]SHJ86046.1 transcriptional antiterminator NusG [Clostridium cavendishii DSM 21758]